MGCVMENLLKLNVLTGKWWQIRKELIVGSSIRTLEKIAFRPAQMIN